MCGIVGMVSSSDTGFTAMQEKIFNQLLFCDTLRGDDSTGTFGVNKYGNVEYLKASKSAPEFVSSREYKDFSTNIFRDFRMVCGHNRKATRGFITDDNAHPFVEENTILVHNGTLINHEKLTKETVKVDSHAILHSLNERGTTDTIKDIQGAFALSWYSADKKELNLIRNNERPLHIVNTAGAWYFASELKLLEWVLERNSVKIEEVFNCAPGTLYTFKLEDKDNMWMTPLELYTAPKIEWKKTEEKKEIKDIKELLPEDFQIGTQIIMTGIQLHKVKPNSEGQDRIWAGHWFFDDNVKIRLWTSEKELQYISNVPTINGKASDSINIIYCRIKMVMSKGNKITLICNEVEEYVPATDSTMKEIFEDEYMLTSQTCGCCRKKIPFEQIKNGVFNYTNKNTYTITCEECEMMTIHGGWYY